MNNALVGCWWAPCCMEDLHQIATAEDVVDFLEWIMDDGPFAGLFRTREDAEKVLLDVSSSPNSGQTKEVSHAYRG